jgi:hypothetical protein
MRNPLNRPMRTRMSGGVAGESGRPLPLCRFYKSPQLFDIITNELESRKHLRAFLLYGFKRVRIKP